MSLNTHSKFYYGFEVTADNQFLDFDEGSGELFAELLIGTYSMEQFADEVSRALNESGLLDYVVTVDRATRIFTIDASSNVELLVNSGAHNGTSAYSLFGFTGADRATDDQHFSNVAGGFEYSTQFILQSYVKPEHQRGATYGTVNKSASGQIEVVSFGTEYISEFNLKFVNDFDNGSAEIIRTNLTGVADLIALMTYLTGKGPFEFMPDEADSDGYYTMILESTQDDQKGLKFRLKELYSQNLPGYFETGVLKCRVVD